MSQRDLAEAIGVPENYVSKSLGKAARRFTSAEMDAIRTVLAPEDDRARLRTIPLLGTVPAGGFQVAEQVGGRRLAVSDPETPPNAYALTVKGDSMDLVVPDGSTIVVDPDDTALWPDYDYVVMTEDGEATYKNFQADPARLVPCSSNPAHREIMLGAEPVKVLGKVFSYTLRRRPRRLG